MKKKELLKKIEELEERLLILDDEELSRLEEGYLVGRLEALENRILILEAASSYHYYRYPPIYVPDPPFFPTYPWRYYTEHPTDDSDTIITAGVSDGDGSTGTAYFDMSDYQDCCGCTLT